MKLTVIESPYAGDNAEEIERHVAYARRALAHALSLGESPYASHVLLTQPGVLDDADPEQRALGIEAGFAWARYADVAAFYVDLGWSGGMKAALERHKGDGLECVIREIGA